jgi:hypothetical protein
MITTCLLDYGKIRTAVSPGIDFLFSKYYHTLRGANAMETTDFKIPKVQVNVEILIDNGLTTGEAEEYTIFLSEYSRYRKGKETTFEFLNKKKDFIPLKKVSTGEIEILRAGEIIYVKEKTKSQSASQQYVTLFFRNNLRLEVGHVNPLPDSHSRVLDYLNQESRFLLFYSNEQKLFVNKSKIAKVKEP